MLATRPSRYFVEWDSEAKYEQLKERAIKDNSYTEDCDDWFESLDIVDSEDAGDTLAGARRIARGHLHDAHYGSVTICERIGIAEVGVFWDYDDVKEVEQVD